VVVVVEVARFLLGGLGIRGSEKARERDLFFFFFPLLGYFWGRGGNKEERGGKGGECERKRRGLGQSKKERRVGLD
jgi:hypothetical protein